jgi:hypothetical protein
MMLLLISDVFGYCWHVRGAYAECTITFLPSEAVVTLGGPCRGRLLDLPNEIRYTVRGPDAGEDMHVVGDAANGKRGPFETAYRSAYVGMEIVSPTRVDCWRATFGGEDDVDIEFEVGRSHEGNSGTPPGCELWAANLPRVFDSGAKFYDPFGVSEVSQAGAPALSL